MAITKEQQLRKNKPKAEKQKRLKKCDSCKERSIPYGSMRKFCFKNECIEAFNEKTRKRNKREAKKAFNQQDRSWLVSKADEQMQRYARYRDYGKPCISCGINYFKAQMHGGHFMPKGVNTAIRFNTWNIHAQCSQCNNSKSGNLTQYEINLREKIGDEKVDWLKCQKHTHKHEIEYLQRLIKIFTKRNKILKSRKGIA